MRGAEFGGAPEGTPELYMGDPDGVVVQLQDATYCGGEGRLGELCPSPEPAPGEGVIALRDINHFTLFVSDQARSIAFYQGLFGMPSTRSQGGAAAALGRLGAAVPGPRARAGSRPHPPRLPDDGELPARGGDGGARGLRYPAAAGWERRARSGPLTSYVTMRMPDRGGAPEGTPELYFTDPDGILLQLQDVRYCGGGGYLGDVCT